MTKKNPFVEHYPERQARPGKRSKFSYNSGIQVTPNDPEITNIINEGATAVGAQTEPNVWVEEFDDTGVVVESLDNMVLKLKVHPSHLIGRKSTGGVVALSKTDVWEIIGERSYGNSTGTGAQQTIAHGLASTPNYVCLSEYNTGGALAYESAPADATNIYVTATLNKTYRWSAEVR